VADEKLLRALVQIEQAASEHLRAARDVAPAIANGAIEAWLARYNFADPVATDELLRDTYALLCDSDLVLAQH
jgi:hypothetical protein